MAAMITHIKHNSSPTDMYLYIRMRVNVITIVFFSLITLYIWLKIFNNMTESRGRDSKLCPKTLKFLKIFNDW